MKYSFSSNSILQSSFNKKYLKSFFQFDNILGYQSDLSWFE
ncbi:MAG: hypothetical protein Q8M44_00195 [bacterium]|nr:hypothetical protein [bacterium]